MRFISIQIAALVLFASFCNATVTNLWSGTIAMSADWSSHQQIASSEFTNVQVGDKIKISTSNVLSGGVLFLSNGNWNQLAGTGTENMDSSINEYDITVTTLMKTQLQSTGLIVGGTNYTATSVDLISGDGGAGLENAVFLGEKTIGSYDKYQIICAGSFASAQVGDLLRVKIKNLKIGAQGHIVDGDWAALSDASDFVQLAGGYYQFTITPAMLTQLQTKGMVVSGAYYTLTGVYVINPSSLPLTLNSSVEVTNNWVWNSSETPSLTVDITNPNGSVVPANVVLDVQTDKFEPFLDTQTHTIAVNAGSSIQTTFNLGINTPGFYHCTIMVNDNLVRAFNIGYAPESVISAPDSQTDFQTFWNTAKSDLALVAPNYTLTLIPEKSTSARNVYLVQMNSLGDDTGNPVVIKGYYAEPTGGGTYPALINYLGYDSDQSLIPYCMSGDDNPGYVELILSTRGQSLNRDNNPYGDWFVYNLGNKDNYYYRGAYMDVIRGIDFIASKSKTQTENIFVQGSSQGGALTIAAAALDTRIKAIAIGIPFMGDFPDYFKMGQWPAYPASVKQQAIGLSDADMYTMLSYFDTKNLAPFITCPVLMASGLQDNVCPPHTHFAPYNNLTNASYKEYHILPLKAHETPDNWYTMYMDFFAQNTLSVNEPVLENQKQINYAAKNNVLYLNNLKENSNISIYNIGGELVKEINSSSDALETQLPTAGIYVVVVKNGSDKKVIKVLSK